MQVYSKLISHLNNIVSGPLTNEHISTLNTLSPEESRERAEKIFDAFDETLKLPTEADKRKAPPKLITLDRRPSFISPTQALDLILDFENGENQRVVGHSWNAGGQTPVVARAVRAFGLPTDMIGIKGNGNAAKLFYDFLKRDGIDESQLRKIDVDHDILSHFCPNFAGTEHWITPNHRELTPAQLEQFQDHLNSIYVDNKGEVLVLGQHGIPGTTNEDFATLIREASENGMYTIWDSKIYDHTSPDLSRAVFPEEVDLTKPNILELLLFLKFEGLGNISDLDTATESLKKEVEKGNLKDIKDLAKTFLEKNNVGIKRLVITLSEHGCMYVDKDLPYGIHIPAPGKDHIEGKYPAGAGDSFIGAFIAVAKLDGVDLHNATPDQLKETIRKAVIFASCKTEIRGAILPHVDDKYSSLVSDFNPDIKLVK